MKPHPKIRKCAKWSGIGLFVILGAIWIGSAWWSLYWTSSDRATRISVVQGQLRLHLIEIVLTGGYPSGWWLVREIDFFEDDKTFEWWFERDRGALSSSYYVPLWAPLLLIALPTIFIWRQDIRASRRARSGHCPNCNYDRTGLDPVTSCPECNAVPNLPK